MHEQPTHDLHSIRARARSLCTLSMTYVGQGPCGVAAASVSRPVAAGPAASHCPSLAASAAHEAQMSCTVSEVRQTCLPIVRDACLVHFVDASKKIDASKLPTPLAEALWHHEKGDEPAHAEWLGCARTGPRARRRRLSSHGNQRNPASPCCVARAASRAHPVSAWPVGAHLCILRARGRMFSTTAWNQITAAALRHSSQSRACRNAIRGATACPVLENIRPRCQSPTLPTILTTPT